MSKTKTNVRCYDQDGELLLEGGGREMTRETAEVFWDDKYRDYRDLAVWVEEDHPEGAQVFVAWTDNEDTDPRHHGQPAGIRHTLQAAVPGGGMGPFVVVVE